MTATICALSACSELAPPKKADAQSIEVLSPATATVDLDPASTDDVVTGIEEATRLVPFILNALSGTAVFMPPNESGTEAFEKSLSTGHSDGSALVLWNKIRVVTDPEVACVEETDICLSIPELKEQVAKTSLVRSLSALLVSKVAQKLTKSEMTGQLLERELNNKLPTDPKNVLFPRIEVLYHNSHPDTGILRNAIRATLSSIDSTVSSGADWNTICPSLESLEKFSGKLGQNADEKSQMLASLAPDAEAEEASVLRRTSNLSVYCVRGEDLTARDLYQNADSLKAELQQALRSLDRLYPATKEARDLIRTFRL